MQRDTSHSHRVDQDVDCCLWNVVPLLYNGCVKLLDIGGNWNKLSYTSIQSIPNSSIVDMSGEYAGHGRTGTFSRNCVQIPATWSCIIMLKHELVAADEWASGSRHGISVHSNYH